MFHGLLQLMKRSKCDVLTCNLIYFIKSTKLYLEIECDCVEAVAVESTQYTSTSRLLPNQVKRRVLKT